MEKKQKNYIYAAIAVVVIVLSGFSIWRSSRPRQAGAADPIELCQEQLQVIAEACSAYSEANSGQPPPSLEVLIVDGFSQPDHFLIPAEGGPPGVIEKVDEWSHYRLAASNPKAEPASRMVAYCLHKTKDATGVEKGVAVVVFADKHTAVVPESAVSVKASP